MLPNNFIIPVMQFCPVNQLCNIKYNTNTCVHTWSESVEVHVVVDGGVPGSYCTNILLVALDNGQLEELIAVFLRYYCIISSQCEAVTTISLR